MFAILLITLTIAFDRSAAFMAVSALPQTARLSLEDVKQSLMNRESEEAIIAKIKAAMRSFEISPAERKDLEANGASETLILTLQNWEYKAPPRPNPTPAVPAVPPRGPDPAFRPDAYASKVPPAPVPGAYLLQKTDLAPIDIKSLLPEKQRGILPRFIPLLSAKVIGALPGAASRIRVESTPAVFYLRLPETIKIEDVIIVSLEVVPKVPQRQLEFNPSSEKGGKPTVKTASIRQFDQAQVGPGLYRIATTMLSTGEYMFYLVGSADPAKSIQGKGYDFGVN